MEVLGEWTWAPVATTLVVVGVLGYAAGCWRCAHAGRPQPPVRMVAAAAATLALVLALNSAVGVYATQLFWVHMIQHLLLIMIIPPLLVWADLPYALSGGRWSAGLRAHPLGRVMTSPALTVPCYAAVVVLTHLTGFQQAALDRPVLHGLEIVAYLATGYLLFLPLVEPGSGADHLPDLIRFAILAAAMGVDTLAGVALMLTAHPLAPAFAERHPGWGLGALADQQTAGAVMWFGGDGIMMMLIVVIAIMWGTDRHRSVGLGDWLEGVRRRELLQGTDIDLSDEGVDVDIDQLMLDAYNARLAELDRRESRVDR